MDVAFNIFILMFFVIFFSMVVFFIVTFVKTVRNTSQIHKTVTDTVRNSLSATPVNSVKREQNRNSHDSQLAYSHYYSEKPIKDSGVKDGPLSEAEKNVLYGK